MQQTWTLHVKGFGKIREAAITVKPMLLFIGKNNTGKSYLSMLLWGLLAHGQSLFPKTPPDTPAYQACVRWLEDFIAQQREELTTEDCQVLIDWFNELLDQNKAYFIETLLNSDNIKLEHIFIEKYELTNPIPVKHTKLIEDKPSYGVLHSKGVFSIAYSEKSIEPKKNRDYYAILEQLTMKLLTIDLSFPIPELYMPTPERLSLPVFMPAARTGFMLNYKALAAEGVRHFGRSKTQAISFPLATVDFLSALITLPVNKPSKFMDIATWLETQIVEGSIEVAEGILPEFHYIPTGTHEKLSMHLSSSLVTELAPLILFIRSYDLHRRVLIIEEPEAHLHLEAQRYLARALVRLVNRGVPIWLTTHGDTLFQQINNLIYFYKLRNRGIALEEMDYTTEDLLAPENVGAYEFETENGATVVKELALTYGGFPTPTFTRTIVELSREIYDLQEADDDDEN